MYDYEQIFHKQELYDMFSKGEVESLEDLYGIEDLVLSSKEIDDKIEFYKGLKAKKIKDITDAIKVLENKKEFFKKVILTTLKKFDTKSVDFPGSCRASSRRQAASWNISDEEEFIKIMERAEEEGEKVEGVIEEVKEFKIRKKLANKLLDIWEKNGNLDKYFSNEESKCVVKEPSKMGITFTFPKNENDDEVIDETIPIKDENIIEDFDGL